MATSGTVGSTVISVATLIDHAMRRCGLSPTQVTPDLYQAAQDNLYFFLSALANDGIDLWTVEKNILGLLPYQNIYYLETGTVDVLQVSYRNLAYPSDGSAASSDGGTAANAFDQDLDTTCIQTATNGNISYDFGSGNAVAVTTVGIMPYGDQTYTLEWQSSSDGATWHTVYTSPANQVYSDREWTYWDIDAPRQTQYFRVRETGGGTLSVREVVFGSSPQDITMGRMNSDMYATLVNKQSTGTQPLQYWFDRQTPQPRLWLWPTPSNAFVQMVVWRTKQIQDVTSLSQTVEVPQRWIEYVVNGLAAKMCLEVPETLVKELQITSPFQRIQTLQAMADIAKQRAQNEERDPSPIMWAPNISPYTA